MKLTTLPTKEEKEGEKGKSSGDERVTHLGLKALLPKDESITDSKDETSDSTNDLFESLFSDCEENRESVSNNSSLESPLFLSKWKLLERREEIEKERMYASFLSISRDKWSKCRPVHVRTEPLVDILGVSLIKHNSDEQEMWELFGSIYVSDGKKRCLIYEHEDEKKGGFKSISSPATLSLTGPDSVGSAELSTIVKSKKPQEFERIETITLCGSGKNGKKNKLRVYGTIYAEYIVFGSFPEKIRVNLLTKTLMIVNGDRADNHPIVQDSCVFETYNYGGFWGNHSNDRRLEGTFLLDDDQNTSFWSSTSALVFSMFIGHQNNEQLQLYGMINVSDSRGMFNIFKRDKGDPYVLPWGAIGYLLKASIMFSS
ncbi:putative mannose-6-phosphate isomerase YvyI [Bienertia sinuspersici]